MMWYQFRDSDDILLAQAGFINDEAAEMYAESLATRNHKAVTYYRECGEAYPVVRDHA